MQYKRASGSPNANRLMVLMGFLRPEDSKWNGVEETNLKLEHPWLLPKQQHLSEKCCISIQYSFQAMGSLPQPLPSFSSRQLLFKPLLQTPHSLNKGAGSLLVMCKGGQLPASRQFRWCGIHAQRKMRGESIIIVGNCQTTARSTSHYWGKG